MEKEAKKQVTEEICRQLELMMKGGASGVEAARLVGISQGRASKIKKAGFSYEVYRENDRKEREKEKQRAEEEPAEDPPQVPGQIEMDLTPAEDKKPEMSENTKMMRFQAGQLTQMRAAITENTAVITDRTMLMMKKMEECAVMLNTKLDRLNDTLSMILRAVRKE